MNKMPVHRYELVDPSRNMNKFWAVQEPYEKDGAWIVGVHYGRIGTNGQQEGKALWSATAAKKYYEGKVAEKLKKGYKYISKKDPAKPAQPVGAPKPAYPGKPANPAFMPKAYPVIEDKPYLKEDECVHSTLSKTSTTKWKCKSCGYVIDFDAPPKGAAVVEVTQVRRFIDLSAFKG